jgi:hypothetical protein
MRVRDHVMLSTAGAVLLRHRVGRRIAGPWAASILIDVDHYVWFCVRRRRMSPLAAVRFFNEAQSPQGRATRLLHSPVLPALGVLLGVRRRWALPVAAGIALHIALDAWHEARMDEARAAALRRDDFTCQRCGIRGLDVGTHVWRQPRLIPSFATANVVALCSSCHHAAHANGARPAFEPRQEA